MLNSSNGAPSERIIMRSKVSLFVLALIVVHCCSSHAQAPPELFKSVSEFGDIEPRALSGGVAVTRFRVVQTQTTLVNEAAASDARRGNPQSFGSLGPLTERPTLKVVTLNLFENVTLVADLKGASTSQDNKTITWSGVVRGANQSSVTLAVTGRTVFGNVSTNTGPLYEIRPIGNADSATQAILEVDPRSFPKESAPIPIRGSGTAQDVNPNATPVTLNVLVAYTQAAAAIGGGANGIVGLSQVAESETNQGYANSGVTQRIKVVGLIPVQYDEKDGYEIALERLANPHDGYMDDIHSSRSKLHADMVVLLIRNDQSCGLSYLAQPPTRAFAPKAFSVVSVGCATGYFSFGHELGHLQGCNHDRADATGPGAFPYSYGYQQMANSPHFRDIMSYDCAGSCVRINYWSNPQITYKGIPVGEDSPQGSTNNALTLNLTQFIAVGWRP